MFVSFAYAIQGSQWTPILMAASALPWLSFVYAAKPPIAAALWIAFPSWRALAIPAVLTLATIAIWPWWVAAWMSTWGTAAHVTAPITFWGGPLVLLALLRWRQPEARLIAALACVPHSTYLYETLPLFLVAKRIEEAVYLVAATVAVRIALTLGGPYESYPAMVAAQGQWAVWLMYLPCLAFVIRRA